MLKKLLGKNISIGQIIGYALAALVGMTIIFTAFVFFQDIKPVFSSSTGLFKKEYLTINKKVSILSAVNKSKSAFTRKEIESIKKEEFVKSVSFYTPCLYSVTAYTNQMGGFSTEMFFESVPDRLLDGVGKDWKWNEQDNLIPIMIPRDYLALYNFGFATSRGLPQISEEITKSVTFNVIISGNGKSKEFEGRIAGFSDYLNTILVPESFMIKANQEYGDPSTLQYSRLIIEVQNPADPGIAEFFAKKDYEISENKGEQGKLSYFLKLLVIMILIVGCSVMLPAIGLMMLSINLLIFKNQITMGNLILLGYSRNKLSMPYSALVTILNFCIAVLAFVATVFLRGMYVKNISPLGISLNQNALFTTAIFAICFAIFVSIIDILWIRNKIAGINPPRRG